MHRTSPELLERCLAEAREMVDESRLITTAAMHALARTKEAVDRARRDLDAARKALTKVRFR